MQIDYTILDNRPDLELINKMKTTFQLLNFDVPVDHSENKKKQKNWTNSWTLP